ncbi:MAG: aminotransferase class V-fold PLP-dependent enzyme [Ignavibacteriae bacterium]|nr:aminotransferase class V-fold PLP-dependent enzyme [Ignavibacteriota bacterium]
MQNYAGAIGLAAACKYLEKIGMNNIEKHEKILTEKMRSDISSVRGIEFAGRKSPGIVSFNVKNMGFHDVAVMIDEIDNIMIRSGQHCAHSWFNARSLEGCCRASLYLYNNEEDLERFSLCLKKVAGVR